ncbi:MAG: hypothetical protein JSV39_04220 [Candidatus Aenigmatarchaeota archaeon]|nr:MAG: hypothetical protein JSV39_04220 [Candidatus Aenigmarchaeota archaeon]
MKFLDINFRPGFTTYRNGEGPVWVCPHSGPALEVPTSRDENTDTVASRCWLKTGGSLIVSNISRKMTYGVDFNRDIPPKELSLNLFEEFVKDEFRKRLQNYRKEYAWVSKNETDYRHRNSIYDEFWRSVKRSGNVIVFVHRQFTRMKNFPSAIDIITYRGGGVDKKIVEKIAEKMNKKYERFFRSVSRYYKDYIILEQKRIMEKIKRLFSEFNMDKMKIEFRENILADLEVMRKYADKNRIRKLEKEFNEKNFIAAMKSALRSREHPKITVESIFHGQRALRIKKPMFIKDNIVMEVECTSFLNYWYPDVASDILIDLLKNLVSVDLYKKMGAKQTQILKFVSVG